MKDIKKFVCISKKDGTSLRLKNHIQNTMIKKGWQLEIEKPEFVFVIGGDGTFIRAIHKYVLQNPIYYPIHTGTLGFFAEYKHDCIELFLEQLDKPFVIQEYPLLETELNGRKLYGLNEIRIENPYHTQIIDVIVNDKFFETLRGSGVCISSQAGSTAYNRSLGGAILAHGMEALQMVEIAGIHNQKYQSLNVPIVFPSQTVLSFTAKSFNGAILGLDSNILSLRSIHQVVVKYSLAYKVRVLRTPHFNYLDNLKSLF